MSKLQFCPVCQRQVQAKKCNKLIMIILLCIGVLPGVIYWILCGGNKCPICGYKF